MAVRSARAPSGSGLASGDGDVAILADGVSKRYPRRRVTLFPPIVSMFDRNWFSRQSSPAAEERTGQDDIEDADLDDEDDEDDEDFDDEAGSGPDTASPGEMFWALRDVSFQVPHGSALGVLGGPGAGKSTLLGILGGRVFPTEGRVLVHDPVSPVPAWLARALGTAAKGSFDLLPACRLLGIDARLVKRHRDEIEELAGPLRTSDGDLVPQALIRLAMATTAVLPASVILLEEPPREIAGGFMERVVDRARRQLQSGSSLVLASRKPERLRELCDEIVVLDGDSRPESDERSGAPALSDYLSRDRELLVPRGVPAFNASASLLSATIRTPHGRLKRIDAASDEVRVKIRFETAHPDIEAVCGVSFLPRRTEGPGVRVELPEPVRFVDPRTYVLIARIAPPALRTGAYEVRADAVVANPEGGGASVIARHVGRIRVVGDNPYADEAMGPPIPHWDGHELWRAEAEWSIA